MVKKKRRKKFSAKTKGRMVVIFFGFGIVICALGYTLLNNLNQINSLVAEKNNLNNSKKKLKEEQDSLKADIGRLSDSEYIARYAREKYYYSKNGEFVLRIDS